MYLHIKKKIHLRKVIWFPEQEQKRANSYFFIIIVKNMELIKKISTSLYFER